MPVPTQLPRGPLKPAGIVADSIPKSLFLGSRQSECVTENRDLRSLARPILLAFQQASLALRLNDASEIGDVAPEPCFLSEERYHEPSEIAAVLGSG